MVGVGGNCSLKDSWKGTNSALKSGQSVENGSNERLRAEMLFKASVHRSEADSNRVAIGCDRTRGFPTKALITELRGSTAA